MVATKYNLDEKTKKLSCDIINVIYKDKKDLTIKEMDRVITALYNLMLYFVKINIESTDQKQVLIKYIKNDILLKGFNNMLNDLNIEEN